MCYPDAVSTTLPIEALEATRPGPHHWADFIALSDDDKRELIDGYLVELEVPTELHEWIVAYLTICIGNWCLERGGRVLTSGYKVRVSDLRGVMPDVQLYREGRPANPPQGLEEGAPDLAVEVISPSSGRYDRLRKREWYAAIGTPEYWIVDPELSSIERLVLREGVYAIAQSADRGTFRPESFEGLEIDIARMFTLPE